MPNMHQLSLLLIRVTFKQLPAVHGSNSQDIPQEYVVGRYLFV